MIIRRCSFMLPLKKPVYKSVMEEMMEVQIHGCDKNAYYMLCSNPNGSTLSKVNIYSCCKLHVPEVNINNKVTFDHYGIGGVLNMKEE